MMRERLEMTPTNPFAGILSPAGKVPVTTPAEVVTWTCCGVEEVATAAALNPGMVDTPPVVVIGVEVPPGE
jgi:hypothetical protein